MVSKAHNGMDALREVVDNARNLVEADAAAHQKLTDKAASEWAERISRSCNMHLAKVLKRDRKDPSVANLKWDFGIGMETMPLFTRLDGEGNMHLRFNPQPLPDLFTTLEGVKIRATFGAAGNAKPRIDFYVFVGAEEQKLTRDEVLESAKQNRL